MYSVTLPSALSAATLEADPSVTRVDANQDRSVASAPNDPSFGSQWALGRIGWEAARDTVTPSGSATVAILDTGVDATHPDLDGNLVAGTSIIGGSATTDPNGHGTQMAGIVAAETNNGEGVAGVGYAGVKVMPVRVLGADGTGQDSDIIQGVVWAADHGADVILMSFSNPGYSESLQAALDYAWSQNVVLVAATGNGGSTVPTFPAGDRGVIGVSSTGLTDSLSSSSNSGPATFLAAPGESVLTTSAGGGYGEVTGTSASAAIVAGAAALLRASSVGASNGVIVSRLARNAEPAGTASETGNGRVDSRARSPTPRTIQCSPRAPRRLAAAARSSVRTPFRCQDVDRRNEHGLEPGEQLEPGRNSDESGRPDHSRERCEWSLPDRSAQRGERQEYQPATGAGTQPTLHGCPQIRGLMSTM